MCNFQCLQIDTVDQDTCKKKIEAIFPSPSAMKSDTNDKWNKGSYLKAFTTVQNQTSSCINGKTMKIKFIYEVDAKKI